jgi:hypothetical protein
MTWALGSVIQGLLDSPLLLQTFFAANAKLSKAFQTVLGLTERLRAQYGVEYVLSCGSWLCHLPTVNIIIPWRFVYGAPVCDVFSVDRAQSMIVAVLGISFGLGCKTNDIITTAVYWR